MKRVDIHYWARVVGCAVIPLLLGCFEQPVQEHLHLNIRADATVEVDVSVKLLHPKNPDAAVERRLQEREEAWLGGFDPWGPRFERLGAADEEFYWQKRGGRLVYGVRTAVVEDLEALEDFLDDTAVEVAVEVSDGTVDLGFYPGPSGRVGRRERRKVEKALVEWTASVAEYLEAGHALYRYLDDYPGRAEACFAEIFDADGPPLEAEEEALLETLSESMYEVLGLVKSYDFDDGFSLDEVARKVYDPFPASLSLELPVEPDSVEGFVRTDAGWAIPERSPWAAFQRLSGRWLSPEPLVASLEQALSQDSEAFDVAAFARQPRRHAPPPDAEELHALIVEDLETAPAYRLVWGNAPPAR